MTRENGKMSINIRTVEAVVKTSKEKRAPEEEYILSENLEANVVVIIIMSGF